MNRKFLTFSSDASPSEIKECFDRYYEYLSENKLRFPPHAFQFANADWHFDPQDPKCPHDAWVVSVAIKETRIDSDISVRRMDIQVELLGAYHDGIISIHYSNVQSYDLGAEKRVTCHGDWLIDEIYLTDRGDAVHEIEFDNAKWKIVCEDIRYSWSEFNP